MHKKRVSVRTHRSARPSFPVIVLTLVSLCLYSEWTLAGNSLAGPPNHPSGGYVVGNFGISSQVSEVNGPEFWIKINPATLGVWLQNFAHGELWIRAAGSASRMPLQAVQVSRVYPEYEATFKAEGHVRVKVDMFAPLGLQSRPGFLPGLILRATVESGQPWNGTIGYTLTQANESESEDDAPTPWPAASRAIRGSDMAGVVRGPSFLAAGGVPLASVNMAGEADQLVVSALVKVQPAASQTVTFVAGSFDARGRYTHEARDAQTLASDLISHATSLREQLHAFVDALPHTGDAKIDEYLRWYISAGILLTKADRDGHVLTMGYRELNQRDSFWASGLHLVIWNDLERKMLLESAQGQHSSGRIPTTLLPAIDRGDEIDSSEYFILRAARDYRWYRDDLLLAQLWPAIRKAIDYLASRDSEHVGVPMQQSFWADWKDVPAEQGRRYAPHFALLWLASLRAASELALALKDTHAATQYASMADRAAAFINRPYAEGGLWNGSHYVERWDSGKLPPYVLEDQLIGACFNVIPADRLTLIYHQLVANETPWGVREKFPYQSGWTEATGGSGGNYHNGGIWPYLNFVDVSGRYRYGNATDAERIIREIGQADLDAQGDEKPGEYLNGDSGANRGNPLQAWDAAMFPAIYFGAFGLERTSRSQFDIHVHVPPPRDFSTRIVLPGCTGRLSRKGGQLTWEDGGSCHRLGVTVTVRQ